MPGWVMDILKIIFGGGVISLVIEVIRRYKGKAKESAEISNIYKEGQELNITIKTNIDKYVDERTKALTVQITELEKTIVQISSKYRNDLEKYMQRIADLEKKFDEQSERTKQVENELLAEQKSRTACYDLIKTLQARLVLLEPKT